MLKFIIVLYLIVASNFIIGQEISTWLYTADNTEKMPLSLGVKVINNEIITNSPTLVKKGNLSNYFFNYLKFSSEGLSFTIVSLELLTPFLFSLRLKQNII